MQPLIPDQRATRRNSARDGTPGRCTNLDYCSIGMQRVMVKVPVGQPFVCPECGGKLRPPGEGRQGRPLLMPVLRILVLLVGIGLGGWQGYLIGRMQPAVRPAVSGQAKDAEIKVNTAREMLGLKELPHGDMAPAAEAPQALPLPPASPPPAQAAATPVQMRPYPTRTLPLELADPSQHLQKEERFGQVTVDCTLIVAQAKPACHIGDVRGGDAFSAASLEWLRGLAVRYAPEARDGARAQLDHRWRVIFEDFSGVAAAAKPPSFQSRR